MEFVLDINLKDLMMVDDMLMVKRDVFPVRCIWHGMENTAHAVADYYDINLEL